MAELILQSMPGPVASDPPTEAMCMSAGQHAPRGQDVLGRPLHVPLWPAISQELQVELHAIEHFHACISSKWPTQAASLPVRTRHHGQG